MLHFTEINIYILGQTPARQLEDMILVGRVTLEDGTKLRKYLYKELIRADQRIGN